MQPCLFLFMIKLVYEKLSVVIPSYNEAKTVGHVVGEVLKLGEVDELILVDDGSKDTTTKKIEKFKKDERFKYIKHAKNEGKGVALKTGIKASTNDVILLLDADLKNITAQKIKNIFMPVLEDKVDVSRASFSLSRGRVTEIAVKPMMKILFPDIELEQPITGQVCAKKEFLERIDLENRWGVDIGILLDAMQEGQRIKEVNIGKLEHKAQSMEEKAEMARQVLETMIKKTGLIHHKYKMVVFTFDKTLIQKSTLRRIYQKLGIYQEIFSLYQGYMKNDINFSKYLTKAARLFKGKRITDIEEICNSLPVQDYSSEVVSSLKHRKYQVALVSNIFLPIVEPFCKKLGITAYDAVGLEQKNGILTGNITTESKDKWFTKEQDEAFKKSFQRVLIKTRVKAVETIMVANAIGWKTVLGIVGMALAYKPEQKELKEYVDKTIHVLPELLALVE